MPDYLSIPLAKRAAMRKADTIGNLHNFPAAVGGIWTREGSGSRFNPIAGKYSAPVCYLDSEEAGNLRWVNNAHEILPRSVERGWYVDGFQSETTQGVVYRLPGGRFIAGASDPWNCDKAGRGPCFIARDVFNDPEDAARFADRLAEQYGEFCREDDANQQAESQIEDAKDSIGQMREEIRSLVAGIRESSLSPAICERLRKDIRNLRADMAKRWERIRLLTREPWQSVA